MLLRIGSVPELEADTDPKLTSKKICLRTV